MKIIFFILLIFCTINIQANASIGESIKNFFSSEYEEYTNPDDLYNEIIKDFLDKDYSSCADKISKFIKYHPFYPQIKKILVIEILSNFLAKRYELVEPGVDNYLEIYGGDIEIFYILYIKALSLRLMVKNSYTNMGLARDSLNLFRLLKRKIQKIDEKEYKNNQLSYEINVKIDYNRFKDKIDTNIKELCLILSENNAIIEEYYFDSGYYISAIQRNLFVINNEDEVFSKKDKDIALKRLNIIFNKIFNK